MAMFGAVFRAQYQVPQRGRDTEIVFRVVMMNLVVGQEFSGEDVLESIMMQGVMR